MPRSSPGLLDDKNVSRAGREEIVVKLEAQVAQIPNFAI